MDLSTLQKQAILVPTPGQTEQEYLGKYHQKISKIKTIKQNDFVLKENENHSPVKNTINNNKLMTNALNNCGL